MSDTIKETKQTSSPQSMRKPLPDMSSEDVSWVPQGSHLSELVRLKNLSGQSLREHLVQRAKLNTPLSFLVFLLRAFHTYLTVFILSPQTILFDPLSTIAGLILYPAIGILLYVALLALWIFSLLGGQWIVDYLGMKYARGYSIINWLNPEIFVSKESQDTIEASRAWLNGSRGHTTLDDPTPNDQIDQGTTRIFSLTLSKTFLLLSSLVYERRDSQVTLAAEMAVNHPFELEKAEEMLALSMQIIVDQAAEWGMRFEAISDLASNTGPFASVFYNGVDEELPWIAVVFKGTTPTNFGEILVDAALVRMPASIFLSGSVHEGFYSDLFPTEEGGSDGYGSSPVPPLPSATDSLTLSHATAGAILRKIKILASTLRQKHNSGPVPLWISGHSLGSALASLLYSRFLISPKDLGDDLELRDCYSYGTPRLGDGAFASGFEKAAIDPLLRPTVLYRVMNNSDIVCRIPPGLADAETNRDLLGLSVFNYAHVGCEAYLKRHVNPGVTFDARSFHQKTRIEIKDGEHQRKSDPRKDSLRMSGSNPLRDLLVLLPSFILDHFPASYYSSLLSIDAKHFNHPLDLDLKADVDLKSKAKKVRKAKSKTSNDVE